MGAALGGGFGTRSATVITAETVAAPRGDGYTTCVTYVAKGTRCWTGGSCVRDAAPGVGARRGLVRGWSIRRLRVGFRLWPCHRALRSPPALGPKAPSSGPPIREPETVGTAPPAPRLKRGLPWQTPAWLEQMIAHTTWRDLFYKLAEAHPDCLMLNFTVKVGGVLGSEKDDSVCD